MGAANLVALAATLLVFAGGVAAAKEPLVTDKIIVSGASGQLGRLAVKDLLARGVPAKNLILVSRTPGRSGIRKTGRQHALRRFQQTGIAAPGFFRGNEAATDQHRLRRRPTTGAHKHAIDAAIAAGVKQIAYTSFVAISGGDAQASAPTTFRPKRSSRTSGVKWTMLRNSIYQDVLVGQAARMVAEGHAVVPAKEVKLGYVSREDCAAAAAAVLTTAGTENKAYDITGPELIG